MSTKYVLVTSCKGSFNFLNNCPLENVPRKKHKLDRISWELFPDGMDSLYEASGVGWQGAIASGSAVYPNSAAG